MYKAYNLFSDNRRYPRKKAQIEIFLQVGIHLKCSGTIQDISLKGLRIIVPELFAFFKPQQAHIFQNAELAVFLPKEDLSVKGSIIWLNAIDKEIGVSIQGTTNNSKWKIFCK